MDKDNGKANPGPEENASLPCDPAELKRQLDLCRRRIGEMNHRFRNQLQTVLNFMEIQSAKAGPGPVADALKQYSSRIRTIAATHQLLEIDHPDSLPAARYIEDLAAGIACLWDDGRNVEVSLDVPADLQLSAARAGHLGIILNELLTNSFKHAFPPDYSEPRIDISLRHESDSLILSVADNGRGLPTPEIPSSPGGLKIISSLLKTLGGTLNIQTTPHTAFTAFLPAN